MRLEAEITARPVRNLELFSAITVMDTQYKNFAALGGTSFSGNRLVNASNFAGSAGIRLNAPLKSGSEIKANVDATYTSSIFLFPDNLAGNKVDGYSLLNARLAWSAPQDRYEIALWGKNLTNKAYITSVAPIITMDQLNYNEPRTYGVQLSAHF